MPIHSRSPHHFSAICCIWILAGCGGDAGPVTPTSLAITAGNLQSACLLDTLRDSLEVTLTGSNNKVLPGRPVNWLVTSGAAHVSRGIDTTDANGRSRVQLTLGIAVAAVTVSASVTGLPPAQFTATGNVASYALGDTVVGALRAGDCGGGANSFFDGFAMTLPSAQTFTASLRSTSFDATLLIADAVFLTAINDDSGNGSGGTDSFLKLIAAPGLYLFAPQAFTPGDTGTYTLATTATPVAADSCLFDVWVTRGITTDQALNATDCVDNSGPYYFDVFDIILLAGKSITVSESSTAFDADLFLFVGGTLVASDDNSGGGTNARLTYQAPAGQSQLVDIVAATADTGETGAYTLSLAPTGGAATTIGPALFDRRAVTAPFTGGRRQLVTQWRRNRRAD